MKLGVLCSGNLGLIILKELFPKFDVEFVFTDKNSNEILDFCNLNKLEVFIGNPRNEKSEKFIQKFSIDVLISVNYLYIINTNLIKLPKQIAFNIHGSLLPKYRGRTPHVWSIINNETFTGITAHLIDEGCDTGDIIEQIKIKIESEDTGYTILKKYENEYLKLINNVFVKLRNNNLQLLKQDNSKATLFGKRTPEDGLINWNWQKERINNWVRAQAFPYPGAFTFYKNDKIIIDKIKFTDNGFSDEIENGTILTIEPITVKTPNGVIQIIETRSQTKDIEINSLLNK